LAETGGEKEPAPLPVAVAPAKENKGLASAVPESFSCSAAGEAPRSRQSLDEIILDYLVAGDDK
jgi:hypothetical protein